VAAASCFLFERERYRRAESASVIRLLAVFMLDDRAHQLLQRYRVSGVDDSVRRGTEL
jgi:hypothetical protein